MPEPGPVILVIEDEMPIRRFLRASLTNHGYRFVEAANARDGLNQVTAQKADVVILDLGLPDLDGLEFTRQLREWSTVPIIVLTARGQEQDKVAALDAGADDYLTKPFGVNELLARIRVALRHAAGISQSANESVFTVGNLRVDLARRQVFVREDQVHLTPTEYKLLATLVQNAGKVVTHRQLLQAVWGPGYENESNYLRVHMTQLRHKLEADPTRPRYLVTELGVGYRIRME
jgi:two-component system, OmpR family, KDP operon response regulator KdpE